MGPKIHLRITEDLKKKIDKAHFVLFFLDYDGTLCPIRKTPAKAIPAKKIRELLKKLSLKKWAKVYIVSGRTLGNIKQLINLRSVSYVGNHGFELDDPRLVFINKKAENSRRGIAEIYKKLKKTISIKEAIIENKFYTLSIHYRLVKKKLVEKLKKQFYNIAAPYKRCGKISITHGKKVLEVRPNLVWNKGSMVKWILKRLGLKNALIIYIGDDKTDEDAFRALRQKKAITALVSKKHKQTAAKFCLNTPSEVFVFLKEIIQIKDAK